LHLAATYGHKETVALLLDSGADMQAKDEVRGPLYNISVLMIAIVVTNCDVLFLCTYSAK
jgi:ankyrin repeat protein